MGIIKRYSVLIGLLLFPFVLSLPLPLNYKSIAFILFFLTLLSQSDKNFWNLKKILASKIIVLYALLFLFEPLLSVIRDGFLTYSEVRLSFIIAPLIFFLSQATLLKYKNKIFYAFVSGVFCYLIFAVCYLFYFYTTSKYEVFGLDYYLKYVLYTYLPFAIHHTYLGMYICFAAVLILFTKRISNRLKTLLNVPLFLSVFVLGGKFSIISYCLLILVYIVLEFRNNRKVLIYLGLVFTTTVLSMGYVMTAKTDLFRTFDNSINIREQIFKCSIDGIQDNFLLGVGRKRVKQYIENCVENPEIRMDTHNIFLQEFLMNGVFGFLCLGLTIYLLFMKSAGDIKFRLFLLLFLTLGTIEHILSVQNGVIFFVFFSLLFNFTKIDEEQE